MLRMRCWRHYLYRHTILRNNLIPILVHSVNYYAHLLFKRICLNLVLKDVRIREMDILGLRQCFMYFTFSMARGAVSWPCVTHQLAGPLSLLRLWKVPPSIERPHCHAVVNRSMPTTNENPLTKLFLELRVAWSEACALR